jgi:sulfonate transport system substrate-binding protein
MMLKRICIAALIGLVAAGALFLALRGRGEAGPHTIHLGTFSKALGNTPYHVAKHFHWFEQEPALKHHAFAYQEFNDRPAISDAFAAGSLQVLFSGDAPAILCRAQGSDFRIACVTSNAEQEILVRSGLPIKQVEDLRGHSLAVLQGTSSQYALLKILQAHHLSDRDLQIRYMTPPEARTAFEAAQIDTWAVWAPFVEQQEVTGTGRVVRGSRALINSVMSVSTDLIDNHRPDVDALVSVINRAKKWIDAHPREAQEIAASELGLDIKVVQTAWPKFNWASTLDAEVLADLQEKDTFLAQQDKTRDSRRLDVRRELILPLDTSSTD